MSHQTATANDESFETPRFPLGEKLGIRVEEVSPDRTVASLPVESNTQPAGILHGGATAALIETAASVAAQAHADARTAGQSAAVGTEISVSHIRAARSGRVTAVATARHLGRTSTVHEVEVTDDQGRLTATGRVTNRLIGTEASAPH